MEGTKLNRLVYELWSTKAFRALQPIQADAEACAARAKDLEREASGLLRSGKAEASFRPGSCINSNTDIESAHRAIREVVESFRQKRLRTAWRLGNVGTHKTVERTHTDR